MSSSLMIHFQNINDPRVNRRKKHLLIDILIITVVGVLCDCDTWEHIEDFANDHIDWFKKYLKLENGIPSHDTLSRVLYKIKPEFFQKAFLDWLKSCGQLQIGEQIAIDGKELRGSGNGRLNVGVIGAWAKNKGVMLGLVKGAKGAGEVPKIPDLLKILEVKGCVVSVDAGNARSSVAKEIVNCGGDYLMTIKKNEKSLYKKIDNIFNCYYKLDNPFNYSEYDTMEYGHGRFEYRRCISLDTEQFHHINLLKRWPNLKSISIVETLREKNGKYEESRRYFISSLIPNSEVILGYVRGHWSIENNCHWVLDVAFREDSCRVQNETGAQNLAIIRRFLMGQVKKKKDELKISYTRLRKKCGRNPSFLSEVLFS